MKTTDILLLILFNQDNAIVGTTKLQKIAFLVEREGSSDGLIDTHFGFEPYKFGPFSKRIIDDIEFLVGLGYVEKSGKSGSIIKNIELNNIEDLSAKRFLSETSRNCIEKTDVNGSENDEGLGGEESNNDEGLGSDESIIYRISEKGINYLKTTNLLKTESVGEIVKIREKYRKMALIDLLRYVYKKYPEYISESEIKGIIK